MITVLPVLVLAAALAGLSGRHHNYDDFVSILIKYGGGASKTSHRLSKGAMFAFPLRLAVFRSSFVPLGVCSTTRAEIITNIMVPYSLCNSGLWYLKWTSK